MLLLAALAVWPAAGSGSGDGQSADQGAVQLAFLYNFTKFTEWPESAWAGRSEFELCILGEDPFGPALDDLHNRTVKDRPIHVSRPRSASALVKCHLVYVSPSEGWRTRQILQEIARAPILSVSAVDEFTGQGGMIRQFWENGRARFEINLKAAREGGLTLSSKLLELASRVLRE